MAVAHRLILAMLLCLAMSMTWSQYSLGLLLISSDAHKNCTFDIFIPAAFHTSIKYLPTVLILSISPPYLLLSMANQSATQNTKMHPASISLFTFIALRIPWAMCILPEGSNPSQHLMNLFFFRRSLSSSSLVHSTPMDLMRLNLYSSESLEGTGSKYWLILKVKLDLASFSLCFQSCYCWRSQNWRPPVVQSMRDCIQSIKELLQGLLRSIYLERILIFCKRIKGKRETIRGLIRYHLHHFSLVFRKQWADRVSVNPTRLLYSVSFSFFSLYFQWSRLLGVRLRAILVTRDLVGVLEPVIPPLSMYPVTFTVGAFFVSDRSLLAVIDTDLFSSSLLFTARFSLSSSFSIRPFIGFLFSSLGNMQLKASSQLILSSYFILRHILMNSLLFSETQESKTTGFPMMLLISWISFLAGQGVCPCNNSQQISPTDHKSDLFVYLALARICGDMYKGVPTIDLITILCKPKVTDLANPSLQKYIGWLEISVCDLLADQILEPIQDIPQHFECLLLRPFLLTFEPPREISLLTELCHNIHVVASLVDIQQLHNVGVIDPFHDGYLVLDVLEVVGVGEDGFVDDLDSHRLVVGDGSAQVDGGIGSLSQWLLEGEDVLLDLLLVAGLFLNLHFNDIIIRVQTVGQYIYQYPHKQSLLNNILSIIPNRIQQISYSMSSLAKQYLNDEQQLPPLSMTIKLFRPATTKVTLEECEICNGKASPFFCILCGFNFCENCTKKRINSQIVCDYCFLKEYVKKSPLEKEQMFRSLEEATNKMRGEIKEFQANIEKFTNDMIKIEVQETSETDKAEDIIEMENKIKSLKEKYASRKQGLEERKKRLNEKKGEVEGRNEKNLGYEKKLENVRKEIMEKQAIQLAKMEEVDKLKLQLEALERERKEVMKDLER